MVINRQMIKSTTINISNIIVIIVKLLIILAKYFECISKNIVKFDIFSYIITI